MEDLTRVYACPECGRVLGYKACIDAGEEDGELLDLRSESDQDDG